MLTRNVFILIIRFLINYFIILYYNLIDIRMKIKYLIVTILLWMSILKIHSQDGTPFLTNFYTTDPSLSENYAITQSKEGLIVLANRKGVLTFDSDEWLLVKTPEVPYTVATHPESGIVYVGCNNTIGYLAQSTTGQTEFKKFEIPDLPIGIYAQIAFDQQFVYFLSQTAVVKINPKEPEKTITIVSEPEKPFMALILIKGMLLVDVYQDGLYEIKEKTKQLVLPLKSFPLSGKILFVNPLDQKQVLIGTTDNGLFLFDGLKVSRYTIQDQAFINDGLLSGASVLDSGTIALSTYTSGSIIVDRFSGKTISSINYESGLPDDEILAIGSDQNKGLWLAHYYGLTRVDTRLPVRNFSSYKGLEGNIQNIESLNGIIYVSTSNGIYFLDKKKDYVAYSKKEIVQSPIAELKPVEQIVEEQPQKSTDEVNQPAKDAKEEKRGGLFKRLFKKSSQPNSTSEPTGSEKKSEPSLISRIFDSKSDKKDQNVAQTVRRKSYKLQSISHVFTKVEGFNLRCRQMVNFKNHLLVATNSGLYEVSGNRSKPILSGLAINSIYLTEKSTIAYLCTEKGVKELKLVNGKWEFNDFSFIPEENVFSFAVDVFDNYWIGGENKVYRLKIRNNNLKEKKEFLFNTDYRERIIVRLSNKKPLFFLTNDIYAIFNDSIQPYLSLSKYVGAETDFYFSQNDYTWIRNERDWVLLKANSSPDTISFSYLNLFTNINHLFLQDTSKLWVLDNNTNVYLIDLPKVARYQSDFNAFIKSFTGSGNDRFSLTGVSIDKNNKSLTILISAPYYIKSSSNQYQYFVKGLMDDWSAWKSTPEISFIVQKSGDYEMKVRARNIFGNISNEQTLKFTINKAFYETWWFYTLIVIALGSLVYLFIQWRTRKLLLENQILEQKVQDRTREIQKQKEEIEIQRNQITQQHLEITDSIRYAKRLQTAVMPEKSYTDLLLNDNYFIIYRPKDIVSGDFYWFNKMGNRIIAVAADCTGHGVPGGFLSMLGVSMLNEICATDREFNANDILNYLRLKLKHTLIKEGHEMDTKDGMDVALCILDLKNKRLEYSGANNPLWLLREGTMLETKADKMPIGSHVEEKDSFTNHVIELKANDIIYLFSDGFKDQLGGPNGKRLKSSSFREGLIQVSGLPMNEQKIKLEEIYDKWRGEYDQVDDLLVIGIKI